MQLETKKQYADKWVYTFVPEQKWCYDLSTPSISCEIYLGDVLIASKVPFVVSSDEVEKSPLYVYVVSATEIENPELQFTEAVSVAADERVIIVDDKHQYHVCNGEICLMW